MKEVARVEQLFSDVSQPCPVPDCKTRSGGLDHDWLTDQTNHLISEHGWSVLHVGQETSRDSEGRPLQRTTIVLGEPR